MKTNWFIADTHFGHRGIIDLCGRPFKDVDEMDSAILKSINDVVSPSDNLYILGDFCWESRRTARYFGEIHCLNKHIVVGNHDKRSEVKRFFDSVEDIVYLRSNEYKFVLCHYPFQSWRRGWFHLHGHTHGTLEFKPGRIDVGWDVQRRPRSENELILEFEKHPNMEKY